MMVKPWQRPTGEGLLDVDKEVNVLGYGIGGSLQILNEISEKL